MTPTWASPEQSAVDVSELKIHKQQPAMRPVNMSRRRLTQHELLEQARIGEENMDVKQEVYAITAERDQNKQTKKKTGQQARDYYTRYFSRAKEVFGLKQDEIDMCMAKVEEVIYAKANKVGKLDGNRESYAAVILSIISDELELDINMDDIVEKCGDGDRFLKDNEIKNAVKKLRKVFFSWFRPKNNPQQLIDHHCKALGWDEQLLADAKYIVDKVRSEL